MYCPSHPAFPASLCAHQAVAHSSLFMLPSLAATNQRTMVCGAYAGSSQNSHRRAGARRAVCGVCPAPMDGLILSRPCLQGHLLIHPGIHQHPSYTSLGSVRARV